jgi:hypothetical protein
MRDVFLCALVLVVGVGRPGAAQMVTRPFADLGDHLGSVDTVLVSVRESDETRGGLVRVSAASVAVAVDSLERATPSTPPGPPAAQSQAAVGARAPVTSLGALSSRVKPSDRIYVRRTSGEEIVGRFSRASDVSLTLEVAGQTRELLATDVQQVRRRGGNRVKRGMLFGFLAGAAVGTAAGWDAEVDGDRITVVVAGMGGVVGLVWGAVIGAFVHERPLVYRATAPTVRVVPVFTPSRAGVTLAVRF